jgi:phage gp29-like protein
MPLLLASVPSETQDADRAKVMAALESLGSNGRGVISDTARVAFEGSGNNAGDQAYQRMAAACNDEISKCLLGHTGSADSTPGRLGGEGLAGEIRQDLVEADARAIEATIRRDLLAPFVALNCEPGTPVPHLHLQVDAQVSRKESMELAKSAWAMGWPIDMVALASRCGIPLTKDEKKQAPAPGPQGTAQQVAGELAPQDGGPSVATPAVPDAPAAEPVKTEEVALPTLSLNGAQVTALLDVIKQVATGQLPRATGIEVIVASFSIPREQAEQLMGDVRRGFVPQPEAPSV